MSDAESGQDHALCGKIRGSKTARESVVGATDWSPGPNRPHLDERGSAVSIMLPPDTENDNRPRGWRAIDLHLADVAPWLDRFHALYAKGSADDCWRWTGRTTPHGYGIFGRTSRHRQPSLLAHRVAWVAATGRSLVDDLTIDHLCRNTSCVNPAHLEPVTLRENLRRRNGGVVLTEEEVRARRLARGMRPKVCATCGLEVQGKNMARHRLRFHPDTPRLDGRASVR